MTIEGTTFYKLNNFQTMFEEFLQEILFTVKEKQIEHLNNVKRKTDFDIETFLNENV